MPGLYRQPRAVAGKPDAFDPLDMLQQMEQTILNQARQPNVYAYKPHPKQEAFHRMTEQERLFVAGNRSGKSLACVVEGIYYLTHTHPYKKTPPGQIRGRVVAVDFLNGVDKIILPLYKQLMPAEYLINGSWDQSYSKERHILTLRDGSFVEFMSQDQDLDKFAGTSRHFVHFDEECPRTIFDECVMRLLDTNGDWWISETPVEGMEWIYDDLYSPYFEALERGEKPRIGLVQMSSDENPYLDKVALERIFGNMDAETRAVRLSGEYLSISGALYKEFRDITHVVSSRGDFELDPRRGRMYLTGDHGINNPTAWLWVWADIQGGLTVVREYYQSDATVADHARAIKEINEEIGIEPWLTTGDPAMKQRSGVTGYDVIHEYARHGVYINVEGIPRAKEAGINKILQYLKTNPKTGRPFLTVLPECANTIREIKAAKRKRFVNKKIAALKNAPEGQREKDDHTTDALRYLMTFMPDLTPEDYNGTSPEKYELVDSKLMESLGGVGMVYNGHLTAVQRRNERALLGHWKPVSSGTSADFGGMG